MNKINANIQKELLRLGEAMDKIVYSVKEHKKNGNIEEAKHLIRIYKRLEESYDKLYSEVKENIVNNAYITDIPYFRNDQVTAIPSVVFESLPHLIPGMESIVYQDLIMGFGPEFSVSFEELAKRWHVSYPTAFRYMHNLKDLGLLEIKTGVGHGVKNTYKMKYIYISDDIKKFKTK